MLGTLVEIGVVAGCDKLALAAVEAAFARMRHVHERMSFHDAGSDVAQLNSLAFSCPVKVAPETFAVLELAQTLSTLSHGLFDISVAPRLVEWGYLPKPNSDCAPDPTADFTAIELDAGQVSVRFKKPLWIDLGGIAKGYAVDRAIDALYAFGVTGGSVNAGGDLRFFGEHPRPLYVRSSKNFRHIVPFAQANAVAAATSAGYAARKRIRGRSVTALVDPRQGQAMGIEKSVSVIAENCALADALTKIVLADETRSLPVLRHYGAQAAILSAGNQLRILNRC